MFIPRMGRVTGWGWVGFLLAGTAFAAAPPSPFLSTCVEEKVPGTTEDLYIQRPAATRLASPFSDAPFAVHVPVEVPFAGGPARITLRVSVRWDNAPAEWADDFLAPAVKQGRFGLYRADGKPLAPGSVAFESRVIAPKAPSPVLSRPPSLEPMLWFTNGPVATMTFPVNRSAPLIAPDHETGPAHVAFPPDPRLETHPFSFLLTPAQAGWHQFWFVMDFGWPEREPALETLQLRLHVDAVVSRGEAYVSQPELDALFGRVERPAGMRDAALFRSATVEVPVTLRRNGWVFDHATVQVDDARINQPRAEIKGCDYDLAPQTAIQGRDVNLRLKLSEWSDPSLRNGRPPEISVTAEYDWRLGFPAVVPDFGFARLTAAGGVKRQFNPEAPLFRGRSDPGREPWERYVFGFEPTPVDRLPHPERVIEVGRFAAMVARTGDALDASSLEDDRREFVRQYGAAAREWFPADFRADKVTRGPGDREPPLQHVFRGRPPREERARVVSDPGPYPLIVERAGPWLVLGQYRRLDQVEGRAIAGRPEAGDVPLAREEDPFWRWYPGFSRQLGEVTADLDTMRAEAGLISQNLEAWLRSSRILLDALADPDTPAEGPSVGRMVQRQRDLAEKIRTARNRLQALTRDGANRYTALTQELDNAFRLYGAKHPQLLLWRREQQNALEKWPLDMALASRDIQTMRTAAAQAEQQGLGASARLLQAQVQQLTGDTVGALEALRSAQVMDPNDAAVSNALCVAECAFLHAAIRKSQGAIRSARDAFNRYLMERGFGNEKVSLAGPHSWHSVFTHPLTELDGETAWAIFTTGVTGSLSALYGKPEAQAMVLDATETEMTAAFIGLHTVLRLRMRGHSFGEIRGMTSAQLRTWLPPRDLFGQPYSDQRLHELGTSVRLALALPDVQALTTGDAVGLRAGLQKSYWNDREVGHTWIEWLGDAGSMWNLLTFLPYAKAGRIPGAVMWGQTELAAVEAGQKAGTVLSGTEYVARVTGMERALGTLGRTEAGKRWLAEIERSRNYQQSFGALGQGGWTVSKMVALFGTQAFGIHLAEQVAGPKAALAAQFLLLFGGDTELMLKCLKAGRVSPAQAERVLTGQVIPAMNRQAENLQRAAVDTARFREVFERLKKGGTVLDGDSAIMASRLGRDWRKQVPVGRPGEDAQIALAAAAEAARQGSDNGALRAAEELGDALKEELNAVQAASANARKAAENLRQAAAAAPAAPAAPRFVPNPPRNLSAIPLPKRRGTAEAGQYPMPPAPRKGSYCAKGEAALQSGDYAAAETLYEDAYTKVARGLVAEADEMPLEFIQLKISLAAELKSAKRLRPAGPAPAFCAPVTDAQADAILAARARWKPWPKERQGAAGVMHDVEGMPEYVVKVVEPGGLVESVVVDVENEMVANRLYRALGFDIPGMSVHLERDAGGNVVRACYFMRRIEGRPLSERSAAEVFLYREDLARHRAATLLVGDYDRHLGNYLVTKDGRLIPIDAGMGDVRGVRARSANWQADHPYIMEGAFGRDHWYSRVLRDEIIDGPNADRIALWSPVAEGRRKILVAEEALTYNAARPTLGTIDQLMDDEPRLRRVLAEAYSKIHADAADVNRAVEETVANLRKRASRLDQVMRGLNERNLVPLPPWGRLLRDPVPVLVEFPGVPWFGVLQPARAA